LEQAIGVEKLSALGEGDVRDALRGCDAHIVELAEQLVELDRRIEAM
jgi:hypothetical protein